ncbi:MAG: hypothetical protein ACM30H_13575 [Clostridia bacterium]
MDVLREPVVEKDADDPFGEYGTAVTCGAAAILMLAVAAIDKLTGSELRLQILYLIPIAILTWAAGRNWGLIASAVAIAMWVAMFRFSHVYSTNFYFYWDAGVSLGTLVVFVYLLDRLRTVLRTSEERVAKLEAELEAARRPR